jgi:hypothetical protein
MIALRPDGVYIEYMRETLDYTITPITMEINIVPFVYLCTLLVPL